MRGAKFGIRLLVCTVTIASCCMIAETTQAPAQGKNAYGNFLQQQSTKNVLTQSQILDDFNKVAICIPFVGCTNDIPIPPIGLPSLNDVIKGEIAKRLANVLGQEEPIASSANEIFPTVDVLPGGAFRSKAVSVSLNRQIRTSVDGSVMLPPGDYTIPVDVFCMKHSASSPSGHRYLLARLKGKMADVITALNSRSVGSGISHQQLQVLSWNIQGGMKYEAMSSDNQAIVDKLLPDYKSRMSQSFLETVESLYNQFRIVGLPSFDSVLDQLGDVGKLVNLYKQFSNNLRQYGGDYNSLSRLLITSGESNARGGVNNTPWSKISNNVYGRMVTGGNFATPGELQLRVLPELTSSIYSKGALVASNNLTNTLSQKQISSELIAAKPVSKVDITNLVADPQNSNIQPLSMSPSCGGNQTILTKPEPFPPSKFGDLDYYKFRNDDFLKRNPCIDPPDYYLNFGDYYLNKFQEIRPQLSEKGKAFISKVGEALQRKMEAKLRSDPITFSEIEKNSDTFRKFAFETHVAAYCESGWGDLPTSDNRKIASTVRFQDLWQGKGTSYDISKMCGWGKIIGDDLLYLKERLNSLPFP